MQVATYAVALALVALCFRRVYLSGLSEGRYQGFLTALHEFTTGSIAIEGDEIVFGDEVPFGFYDPKTGERITRMKLGELEFKDV